MLRRIIFSGILLLFGRSLFGQTPASVDFARDVQPLMKTYCVGCHGPAQQMNGFRIDRRRDAMRGGTIAVIAPGNSAGSRLYQMLIGSQYGPQMPLTGTLSAQQIEIFKKWIDQGAPWPDALSGETPLPPPDAKATLMMNALRTGDAAGFQKALNDNPAAINSKGFGGSTPLMYAVLYGDAAAVKLLLDKGADPNIKNNAGATALMWVGVDIRKAQMLIDKGADVNAKSDDSRTPLLIASNQFGSTPLVKLFLDHKANPSVVAPSLFGPFTPITGAVLTGNEASLKMLLDTGADLKAAGFIPQIFGMLGPCAKCAAMVKAPLDPEMAMIATTILGPPTMDAKHLTAFLDQGVDVNAKDPDGHTLLMLAANSDALPVDTVKALLDRGADLNAKTPTGQTALDFAALRGNTPVADMLTKAGGTRTVARETPKPPQPAANARAAVQRSLPLLQKTDSVFIQKSGCVSCHNNTLTAVTVSTARKNGFTVNETIAAQQKKIIGNYIESWRDRLIQGMGIPGNSDTVSYMLMGMGAENFPADPATDAMAHFIRNEQLPNGQWNVLAHRPPIESNNIEVTAASLKALQLYAPKTQRAEYDDAIRRAVNWLKQQKPVSNEERVFQLLGLRWGGVASTDDVVRKGVQDLVATQHSNGGWSQLTSMVGDAYATGQALVALQEVGIAPTDAAFKKGIQYLINTQLEDGSWYVKTRAFPIQPYFDAAFPHGRDQFISAAATNWAITALAGTPR